MIEIRFHGRGGQGAVTSAELVAQAAISEGKYAQAFPSFGPERRGAPVVAFTRISDKRIRLRTNIYEPDLVIVLDPGLLKIMDVSSGLKDKGMIIINSRKGIDEIRGEFGFKCRLAVVNATKIAQEIMRLPITNTAMLGAVVKAGGILRLESLVEPLKARFGRIAEKNIKVMQKAYEETLVEEENF